MGEALGLEPELDELAVSVAVLIRKAEGNGNE